MSYSPDISTRFALDVQSVDKLRNQARQDPNAALKSAAQQFEALFLNMVLKSMREAAPQDGLFDSEQTRLYTTMLDQQLAQSLSARGIGLADIMVRQLSRATSPADQPQTAGSPAVPPAALRAETGATPQATPAPAIPQPAPSQPAAARDFVSKLWPHALEASEASGIPARFMLGQAALESGWGRHEIRGTDGRPSHNLFGIKADPNWRGPVVEAVTTEYVNGMPQKSMARFRAYASYGESFRDYAQLLRTSPRYAGVLEQGQDAAAFASGLQQAGYATDPGYADKLTRILNGAALRQTLAG